MLEWPITTSETLNRKHLGAKCEFLQIKDDLYRDYYEMIFKDFDDMPDDSKDIEEEKIMVEK
jgi:hypothetical protein